jgi:TolA-binding protein
VAVVAAILGWQWYRTEQAEHQREQAQISDLSGRISQLQDQNNQLNAALAKVQAEEQRQVTENDLLAKVLEQAKLTGKIPDKLPYPPK